MYSTSRTQQINDTHIKSNKIIHFERSPPDGNCYRRAIEVEGRKGVPVEEELRGGERRKQQEAIEVEAPRRGPSQKRGAGRGEAERSCRRL
jgi:hypothetical protein